MRFTAVLTTTDSTSPESVSKSLNTDNVLLENMTVRTESIEGKITTTIEANNIRTLLNTLDDIVRCQIVAEDVLNTKSKTKRIN